MLCLAVPTLSNTDFEIYSEPWEIPSEDDLERMSEVQSDPFAGGTLWKSMNW